MAGALPEAAGHPRLTMAQHPCGGCLIECLDRYLDVVGAGSEFHRKAAPGPFLRLDQDQADAIAAEEAVDLLGRVVEDLAEVKAGVDDSAQAGEEAVTVVRGLQLALDLLKQALR